MIKIFKCWLIDDYDRMCLENGRIRQLEDIKRINEEQLWDKHLLIEKLKEENIRLQNILSEKIIKEIDYPKVCDIKDRLNGEDNVKD